VALLLAAHGERSDGALNGGIVRLPEMLRARGITQEIATGFITGTPSIPDGLRALRADEIIVYPLLLSDGYFTRIRLPHILESAMEADRPRTIRMLPPIGLDPALVPLLIKRLVGTAEGRDLAPSESSVILLAHGSSSDPASRIAAERIAHSLGRHTRFRAVRLALLEESPSVREAASDLPGPIIVFGLFVGEGMHGRRDAPRLVKELRRPDAAFAGTLAQLDGIADLVAEAVARAIGNDQGLLTACR
jgi:sirohydrochlorin cobaltochelatase